MTINNIICFTFKAFRKVLWAIKIPIFSKWSWPKSDEWQTTNNHIIKLLLSNQPCFIGRIGSVERNIINNYIVINSSENIIVKLYEFFRLGKHLPLRENNLQKELCLNAGFFPCTENLLDKFCKEYLDDIKVMDLIGRFSYQEDFLPIQHMIHVQLESLYPFFAKNPWTSALAGKKVLVIHPFVDTIKKQYKKRTLLFNNAEILPEFELITIKAVQSIAGNKVPYQSWFDALEYMRQEMNKSDYDITIIGCGAYGLPLAAHAKRMGKKSILLGGGLQLLFGIKGRRWIVDYSNSCYRDIFNSHWVYPAESEKPQGSEKVEGGCYWC